MKRLLLAATSLIAIGGVASAADLPAFEEAPAIIAPVPTALWTGFYVGAQLGYAFGSDGDDNCFGGTAGDLLGLEGGATAYDCETEGFDGDDDDGVDNDSLFAGAHIGYDHQFGSFVLGAVADVNWLFDGDDDDDDDGIDLDDIDLTPVEAPEDEFATVRADEFGGIDWFGTARLRAGFAAGNFLIYGTGGLAYGDSGDSSGNVTVSGDTDEEFDNFVDATVNGELVDFGAGGECDGDGTGFTCEFGDDDDDDDDLNVGWSLGAGVDFLATDNFKVGVEYLYVNLGGDDDGEDTEIVFGDGTTLDIEGEETDNDFHTVSVRGSYRFNFGG